MTCTAADLGNGTGRVGRQEQATSLRPFGLIGRKFHVSYSVSGATRLMHGLGLGPQVPARRVAECDEVSP